MPFLSVNLVEYFQIVIIVFICFFKIKIWPYQVATDPKLALTKLKELWNHLSLDEPENQARPTTLEQLIVMLTRESARRIVHFLNFTKSTVVKLPHTISIGVHLTTARLNKILDNMIKVYKNETDGFHSLLFNAFKIHLIIIGILQVKDNNNVDN